MRRIACLFLYFAKELPVVSAPETWFETFRKQYPQGCLVSDLITIQDGQYVVRAAVLSEGKTLATGMAASLEIQLAEDEARARAIALLGISASTADTAQSEAPKLSIVQPSAVIEPPAELSPASGQSINQNGGVSSAGTSASITDSSITDFSITDSSITDFSITDFSITDSSVTDTLAGPAEIEEDDLGPPIETIEESADEESAEPVDEGLELAASPAKVSAATIAMENFDTSVNPVDLSDVIAQTDVELRRLGWTSEQGREYIEKTYGKRSRQQLTDEELMSFLLYLEEQ